MTIYIEQSKSCLKQSVYTVDINRQIQDIERSWDDYKNKNNELIDKITKYDYCIIDSNNMVLEYTDADVANNIQTATSRFDVVRNIEVDDEVVGYLIIKNDLRDRYNSKIDSIALFAVCICGAMLIVFLAGFYYINSRMLKPFDKLKKYATRIASGDLDVPLDMDRNHIFGEFTESFDIMREELLKAREIEKKADKSKKELVAQLSH
ncbi:MAG TPA: sensor histidine kinase, partial [Eubacterium sp.]|nr:sensor histidine kinase [Eubacterium sp.]